MGMMHGVTLGGWMQRSRVGFFSGCYLPIESAVDALG